MTRILSVTSECVPFVKTGGLADVAGALPGALAPLGHEMRTLLPGYPAVLKGLRKPQVIREEDDLFGGPARVLYAKSKGLMLYVVEADHLFGRSGSPSSLATPRRTLDGPGSMLIVIIQLEAISKSNFEWFKLICVNS